MGKGSCACWVSILADFLSISVSWAVLPSRESSGHIAVRTQEGRLCGTLKSLGLIYVCFPQSLSHRSGQLEKNGWEWREGRMRICWKVRNQRMSFNLKHRLPALNTEKTLGLHLGFLETKHCYDFHIASKAVFFSSFHQWDLYHTTYYLSSNFYFSKWKIIFLDFKTW